MSRPILPGFFIAVGPNETLVILAGLGIPGALRFRSRQHAEMWLEKHPQDVVRRDFGPGAAA